MSFTKLNLHPKILQALELCKYTQPTAIQAQAIPHILANKDVMATAKTGTGKTAAYVLPSLQLLLTKKAVGSPRILILSPTRELASQITKVIGQYGKFAKLNTASFIGGMPYHKQLRELSKPMDFIVATPGRLMDHFKNKRFDLSRLEMLVIDEADRMLDMGFINDIKAIVQATPKSRQTLLFSATADDKLLTVMKNLLNNPVNISISPEKVDSKMIQQKIFIAPDPSHKTQILEKLLSEENIFKAIIFSATKRHTAKLASQLHERGYEVAPIHGDLKQNARNRTLAQFRNGEIQLLIATDVAARGIDVADISHVINYDLPRTAEDYVHRIGRTGRAGKTGIAISIATPSEVAQIRQIERYIATKIPMVTLTPQGEQEWQPSTEKTTSKKPSRRKPGGSRKAPQARPAPKFGKPRHPSGANRQPGSHRKSGANRKPSANRQPGAHRKSGTQRAR